jgi:hypothetical protein
LELLQQRAFAADTRASMYTLGFRSNVLFVIAASVGLVASLGRAWYGPAVPTTPSDGLGSMPGPVEAFFSRLAREFTETGGTTGWDALTTTDIMICVLVPIIVVCALVVMTVPALQVVAREVLRAAALAMLGVVVVKLVQIPDGLGLAERRQGAWIALGVTGIAASSAFSICAAPLRRPIRGPSLIETPEHQAPRPVSLDRAGSTAPPA